MALSSSFVIQMSSLTCTGRPQNATSKAKRYRPGYAKIDAKAQKAKAQLAQFGEDQGFSRKPSSNGVPPAINLRMLLYYTCTRIRSTRQTARAT
jgi:hypothetical protein